MQLPQKFIKKLISQPETGMGYQIATIILSNGKQYHQVVILESHQIVYVKGYNSIPFSNNDIVEIILTHNKDELWGCREPWLNAANPIIKQIP